MTRLAIEYRKIGLLATCLGNERIRIDADGHLSHAINLRECEAGQLWSDALRNVGTVDATSMSQMAQAIIKSGLLEQGSESIDKSAEGGKREELDVTIDDQTYLFVQQNSDIPGFRQVVSLLWGVMEDSQFRSKTTEQISR